MPPEVYGALSLACRYCRPAPGRGWRYKERQRKLQAKVQKHLARAVRYQAGR